MAESEKRRARRLNALERMSDAGLESLLLQDFQSQETGESSMDEVLRAAEILSERKDRPTSSQADRAWAEFLENYLPSSGDGLSLYEDPEESAPPVSPPQNASAPPTAHRSGRHPLWLGAIRTAACLLLCFFLGFFDNTVCLYLGVEKQSADTIVIIHIFLIFFFNICFQSCILFIF